MAILTTLKNKLGQVLYPQTLTKAVYDDDGNRLDNVLANKTVSDVKINGTSAKVDGVAEIKTSTGLGANTSGIYVADMTDYYIDVRAYNTPITAKKLDYAVKSAITSTTYQDYTDTEKANARKRIGLGGNWEVIETITLDEAVQIVERKTTPDGTPYNYIALRIAIDHTSSVGGYIMHGITTTVGNNQWVGETTNTKRFSVSYIKCENGGLKFEGSSESNGTTSGYWNSTYYSVACANATFNTIKGLKLQRASTSSYWFPSGTIIQISGVKA